MSNFSKVLRLAFRYRLTFLMATLSAIGVAILWGGNIGAILPFARVAFQGESLQQWIVNEVDSSKKTIVEKTAEVEQLRGQLDEAPPELCRDFRRKIRLAESRINAEREAITYYLRAEPYVEKYLPHDPFMTLVLITGLLLLSTIVKDVFLIANNILVARMAQLTTFDLRKLFFRRTLRMDLATFGNEGTADLMSRFTHDMENVAVGLTALLGRLIREPLKMIACLIGAAWICWRLLLLSLVVAPVAAFLIRWLAKVLKRANRQAMEEMAQIYTALEETFRGIKIVKAFTNESHERRRFHAHSKQYYRDSMRIAQYDSLNKPVSEVMGILTICLALLAGAYLVLYGETHLLGIRMSERPLDVFSLMVFFGMLAGVADPVRKFSDVFTCIQRAAAASDRIFERLERQPKVQDPENPVTLRRHQLDLVFENTGFAYQEGHPVLRDIDLRIPFGQTIAIVGPNGCGKSTLASLIPRFYDSTTGTVRLDGISLTDLRLRDLRKQIGIVSQETILFDDSVLNNIRYGSSQATRDEVIAAAKQAQAHQFIEADLPDGYETVVGQMGGRLSGGQRQRIALARAILRDPAIVILDEATSQVDLESEEAIRQVLEVFTQNRTTIIITHRMSILSLADRIVVMQSGRILDSGTHEELLGRCDLYRRLYRIQFEEPDDKSPLAA